MSKEKPVQIITHLVFDPTKFDIADMIIGRASSLEDAQKMAMVYIRAQAAEEGTHTGRINIYGVNTGTVRTYTPSMNVSLEEV